MGVKCTFTGGTLCSKYLILSDQLGINYPNPKYTFSFLSVITHFLYVVVENDHYIQNIFVLTKQKYAIYNMARGHILNYETLIDVKDKTSSDIKIQAATEAQRWPGLPSNPIQPNPIPFDIGRYYHIQRPVPPLGGRRTRRRGGYVSLSNYNMLP